MKGLSCMLIDFKECDSKWCFVDLRTPEEFAEGTIGEAINVPIFDDEERAIIGTVYKRESIDKAKELAIEAVSKRLPELYAKIIKLYGMHEQVVLFCARGGMRSQTLGSLLGALGYKVRVINGGYKAYRNHVLAEMTRLCSETKFIVVHGNTGVGKTDVLKQLDEMGLSMIDIEGLAKHRGSMLGKVGIGEVVTQKQFEHDLYMALSNVQRQPVFVEAESRRLGTLLVPMEMINSMRLDSHHINLDADMEVRADNIVREYIQGPEAVEEIKIVLDRFLKFLGAEKVASMKQQLDAGECREVAIDLMANYYDPKYEHRDYTYLRQFVVNDVKVASKEIYEWFVGEFPLNTEIYDLRTHPEEALRACGNLLKAGQLVAFPTETVYGLGGNALNPKSGSMIFAAKGRPSDNPLIVHIADVEELNSLVDHVTPVARLLMDAFWPGPLTLVFKKSAIVPDNVTGGLDTVAIRMPLHEGARALIRAAGVPIAAPSANLSGKPSPTHCEHVVHDMKGRIAAILCGDSADIGVESTVVDATGTMPVILRPGGVTAEMIEAVAGNVETDTAVTKVWDASLKPKSPGMKYTHYAPIAEMTLFTGLPEKRVATMVRVAAEQTAKGLKVGILTVDEHVAYFTTEPERITGISADQSLDAVSYKIISLGSLKNTAEMTSKLFDALRGFDKMSVDVILSEGFVEEGLGRALMNRLIKAAGHRVIHTE